MVCQAALSLLAGCGDRQPLYPGEVFEADHENPFAFYDLAQVNDGYPGNGSTPEDSDLQIVAMEK
jgi:hypothetical protein